MLNKRKAARGLLSAVLAVLVFAGTIFVFTSSVPEERRVSSADGQLFIEGRALASSEITITPEARTGPFTAVVGPVFEVRTARLPAPTPWTLTFATDTQGQTPTAQNGFVLYRFDTTERAWHTAPAVFNPSTKTLVLEWEGDPAGIWAVGLPVHTDLPEEVTALQESMLLEAPQGMVGYRMSLALASEPEDFVLIPGTEQRGGCDGSFQTGDERVSHVKELVWGRFIYRLRILWEVGNGCDVGTSS